MIEKREKRIRKNYNVPQNRIGEETEVLINDISVAVLNAGVGSVKAYITSDRLFLDTGHSYNDSHNFSVFCFELSTGKQLWQTIEIHPSGSIFVDKLRKTLEVGLSYGYEASYLGLLDYDGNILERNFRDGYEMVAAAEKKIEIKDFNEAKNLCFKSLETEISENTKIKVAKILANIGELIKDDELSKQAHQLCADFEAEQIKLKENPHLREKKRTAPPSKALEIANGKYWKKRREQSEQDGGT